MSNESREVQMAIKMEEALRDEFHKAAKASHKPAAQLIREFMRDYCAKVKPQAAPAAHGGHA